MPGMISFALLWSMMMSVEQVHSFTLIPGPHCLSKRCADLPLGPIGRSKIPFQRPRFLAAGRVPCSVVAAGGGGMLD